MTERRGRKPDDSDQTASLSADEVARRLSGGASLPMAPARPPRVGLRSQVARDTATILAATMVAVVGWQLLGGSSGGPANAPRR